MKSMDTHFKRERNNMKNLNLLAIITGSLILTACGGNKMDGDYFLNEEEYEKGNYIIISGDEFIVMDSYKSIVDNCVIVNPKQAHTKGICDDGAVFEIVMTEGRMLITFGGDTMGFKKNE